MPLLHHEEEEPRPSRPTGSAGPSTDQDLEEQAREFAEAAIGGPRRDAMGRTLDDALAEDRRHRTIRLRRARQVTAGMGWCDEFWKAGRWIRTHAWKPWLKLVDFLFPRQCAHVFVYLVMCCGCWVPTMYAGGAALALGLFGTVIGLVAQLTAASVRRLLAVYLKHLIPW